MAGVPLPSSPCSSARSRIPLPTVYLPTRSSPSFFSGSDAAQRYCFSLLQLGTHLSVRPAALLPQSRLVYVVARRRSVRLHRVVVRARLLAVNPARISLGHDPSTFRRRWSSTMSSSMTPSTGVSPSVCCWIPASPSTLMSRRSCVVLVMRQPLNKICCWIPRRALYRHGADARILHLRVFWMSARPLRVVGLIGTLLVHTSRVRDVVTCLLASSERPGEEIPEGLYGKNSPYAATPV
jgi:hypothetical protein